jgi:hypothetical protein
MAVVPGAGCTMFPQSGKRRILAEPDRCSQPGERDAVLRREGVHSSSIVTWRRQCVVAGSKRYGIGVPVRRMSSQASVPRRKEIWVNHALYRISSWERVPRE